jgi:colanic acid biosynthesis glycosyl transferase WcaI
MIRELTRSVVFLNRYYWPDPSAKGQLLTDLAEDLVGRGWDVTVITGRTRHARGLDPLAPREAHNGVRIVRIRESAPGRRGLAGRFVRYLRFTSGAAVALLRLPRPDVVVAMTDPPLLAFPALLLAGFSVTSAASAAAWAAARRSRGR